jgi:hypothetical protein
VSPIRPATPQELREQTLSRCQLLLAEKTAEPSPSLGRRLQRLIDSPTLLATFATCSVIILIGLTAWQVEGLQDKTAANILKIFIFQLVAQNLVAALFLPALMFTKHKLGGRFTPTNEIGV